MVVERHFDVGSKREREVGSRVDNVAVCILKGTLNTCAQPHACSLSINLGWKAMTDRVEIDGNHLSSAALDI